MLFGVLSAGAARVRRAADREELCVPRYTWSLPQVLQRTRAIFDPTIARMVWARSILHRVHVASTSPPTRCVAMSLVSSPVRCEGSPGGGGRAGPRRAERAGATDAE